MNRTKIEWCDYTWNPVTGCWGPGGTGRTPKRCWYCYAEKMVWRFYRHHIEKVDPVLSPAVNPFEPWFHSERLDQPSKIKKPSRIFVCSMGDLFGDWVPEEWIKAVLNRTQRADYSHHTYIFLTKNPRRYAAFGPWPSNCWLGVTVTDQADVDERVPLLLQAQARVRFVSVEPMLGPLRFLWKDLSDLRPRNRSLVLFAPKTTITGGVDWIIIGALTGPGSKAHQPRPEWVQALIDQARAAGVPVFLKDNLKWPEKIQEWPG
jgi:protein gp37